jgi:hypothetical protein
VALETTIDVAEIDDLGFRVAEAEGRAHVGRVALQPTRAFRLWAVLLVAIAGFALVGRFLDRPSEVAADAPVVDGPAEDVALGWPSNGHSAFRYPAGGGTTMTLTFDRVPGHDGSIARLDVGGRVEGPIGNVAVQLVSGSRTFEEVTRYYAPIGGRPPAPYGAFDLSFSMPSDTAVSDLWIVARAYLDGHVVAVESIAVDPTWPQVGPDKYILDDVVTGPSRRVGGPLWLKTNRSDLLV